jgi:hypothetical protein
MAGVTSQLSVAVAFPVAAGKVLAVHWIVMFTGQVIEGGELSSTTIVWTHWVLVLPQSSVAHQVREIVYSCEHAGEVVMTSVCVMSGLRSHSSVAVAKPVAAGSVLEVQDMVRLAGHVITGRTLSTTTIVCRHVVELPQSSVITQVRKMLQGGDPD